MLRSLALLLLSELVRCDIIASPRDEARFREEPIPRTSTGLLVVVIVFLGTRIVLALSEGSTHRDLLDAVAAKVGRAPDSLRMFLVQATRNNFVENAFSFAYVHVAHGTNIFGTSLLGRLRGPAYVAEPITENMRAQPKEQWTGGMPLVTAADIAAAENGPQPMLDLSSRETQVGLFTPATRRAIYAILLNPRNPTAPVAAPSPRAVAAAAAGEVPFEVGLWMAPGHGGTPAFCFVEHAAGAPKSGDPSAPWQLQSVDVLLQAISNIGKPAPEAARRVTDAFEGFLAKLAATHWGAAQVAPLPVDFLLAFGRELTPRLDLMARVRGAKMEAAEVAALRSPPFAAFVDQQQLATFQGSA